MNSAGDNDEQASGGVSNDQVLAALKVVHDSKTPNPVRKKAEEYLQQVNSNKDAPYHGYTLAADKSNSPIARHYGLWMLDDAIRHHWGEYSLEQSTALREWAISLAEMVDDGDPSFIANKIAAIWVEIAKRSWVLDWMNMDELLVRLWSDSIALKNLILTILENLSDDIFGSEDAAAGLRETDLNKAYVQIFTPAAVLAEHFPHRETSINVRYGGEGWLLRLSELLELFLDAKLDDQAGAICAVRVLSVLKSVIGWIIPKALSTTKCFEQTFRCLASSHISVQFAAVEVLYSLYYPRKDHSRFSDDEFKELVCPMYQDHATQLLNRIYEWSAVDSEDIDPDKYLLGKKFSETIYNIGMLLQERPRLVPETSDLDGFFQLLVKIATNQSLHISIVALHLWTKILISDKLCTCNPVTSLIPQLLEICSHRMIKYEALPEDSTNPSIVFLSYDTDTMPEKHNFLGNYARFCAQIVGSIVENQPVDAIYHILSQAEQVITHLYDGEPAFNVETYSKSSVPFLKLDAQCNVIEAGLKGCGKWLLTQSSPEKDRHNEVMLQNLKVWCERMLDLTFEDPLVKERVIHLAVGFATGPLKQDAQFAFRVFEYILDTRYPDNLASTAYSDAVKDLQTFCVHQLQKLAMRFSDYMITIYDDIERKVNQVSQEVAHDEQARTRYSSILFIITHRATSVALVPREEHLDAFLQPLIAKWANNEMTQSLSSFDSFCSLIGLGGIQRYMSQRNAHLIQDWSLHVLDDEGKALQTQTQNALEHLPLRATKILLSISVEKLDPVSQPFAMACRLWQKHLPLILPNLLRFISHAHAFHNDTNWASLPQEMKGVVKRILTDRFWQVGISIGSRDEFYAKVGRTKLTLEGLASSIRSTLRAVRETGYQLLEYLSLLDESFYGFKELPKPLSHALFSDANALSTHQMVILVDRLKIVVENCPVSCRSHFLPPIVATLFEQLDRKASSEWDSIEERNKAAAGVDGLDEEMRDESILRQLTYTSVTLVVDLLDPQKPNRSGPALADNPNGLSHVEHGNIRSFMIATPEILKPLILFCTHALRMRDTRSCSLITRVLRSLVPEFDTTGPLDTDVREFISHEVLRACITSLHDTYFVDLQKDLAQLISSIIITYSPRTDTPKGVLLTLSSMTAERVDRAIAHLYRAHSNHRQQRAVVLELFKDLRGVSVSEQGRIAKPDTKRLRSAMQERYMTVDMQTDGKQKELSPDLGGVADMFGQP